MAGIGYFQRIEQLVQDHVYGGPDYVRPATLYLALSTTAPVNDATNVTEPVGNGYARVAIDNEDPGFWGNSSGGDPATLSNILAAVFPAPTGPWGTVTHLVVVEHLTDAVVLANAHSSGQLTVAKSFDSGDSAEFPIGSITATLK